MKIAHVGLDLVPSSGGSVVSIRDFSQVSNSVVISFTQPAKLRNECSAIDGTVHIEVSSGFWGRAFAWAPEKNRCLALDSLNDVDLIVCHVLLRYHVHWVKVASRQLRIPYWVVPHGCLDPYVFSYRSMIKKVWFNLYGRRFLTKAARVIFATEKEKLKASKYYCEDNTNVIHWPVQPIDVSCGEKVRDRIRNRLQIGEEDKILIYLGRLHPMKRPIETIIAFGHAGTTRTHLMIVGPDEEISLDDCKTIVQEYGINNIHLIGPIYGDEKNDYLLASDAYISLSHRENFGYTTAEALSAGLPVILSPGNDLADELVSLDCGWMLKDNLAETAALAIREFSSLSLVRLQEMGQRGRNWALKHLDFKTFSNKVLLAASESLTHDKDHVD